VPHLVRISLKHAAPEGAGYPFSVPQTRALPELDVNRASPSSWARTENGFGKSTLLEGIAAAAEPPSADRVPQLIIQVAKDRAQFIIATHSRVLLACPGARIYSFDTSPISEVAYDDMEHVVVTRDFLNDPESFIGER